MMCHDLSDELAQFDLQKEKELKQILLDYASAQLERHEKVSPGQHTAGGGREGSGVVLDLLCSF